MSPTRDEPGTASVDETPVCTLAEWLGLSPAEAEYIRICNAAADVVRLARERSGLTPRQAARRTKVSPHGIVRMESRDPSFSLDQLILSALTLGASREEISDAIAARIR
jgi:hypothetical protein